MILFRVQLRVSAATREHVLGSIHRVLRSTRAAKGCITCRSYQDTEDENTLLYVEEWEGQSELEDHLRTRNLKILLAVMDLALAPPDVRFDTISTTRGMDVIAAARLRDLPGAGSEPASG